MRTPAICWPWKPFSVAANLSSSPDLNGQGIHHHGALPHLSIAGSFSLYNRQALAASLGLSAVLSDADLILHAYARWDTRVSERLEGQFCFVLLDRREGRILASVDHLGSLPLLYRTHGDRLILAGDMATMLSTAGCPREFNAPVLSVFGQVSARPGVPGETLHKGIYALPPGHFLTADRSGLRRTRYWELSIRPELVPASEDAVYEHARNLVETAVADRLGGYQHVSIMFSGGLDSSALAAVAANYLRGKGRTLLALGAVSDPASGNIPDERPFMRMLRGFDNIELRCVEAAGQGPFDGIEDPTLFETSPRLPALRFLFNALFSDAASTGTQLLIHGGGGESGISGTPVARFLEHATRFRWPTLVRDLRLTANIRKISAVRLLASELRHYFCPPVPPPVFFLKAAFSSAPPTVPGPRNHLWPDSRRQHLRTMLKSFDRCAIPATLPPEFAFGYARPLFDKNLLEFCLAVPSHLKSGDGYGRLMIRKAFAATLPPELAWRPGKMRASPDYNQRYAAQLAKAREFVAAIRRSDPVRDIVDIDRLAQAIHPVKGPALNRRRDNPSVQPCSRVPETINLINFLRQFPGFHN